MIPEMHDLRGREMNQRVKAVAKLEANRYAVTWKGWHRDTELLV